MPTPLLLGALATLSALAGIARPGSAQDVIPPAPVVSTLTGAYAKDQASKGEKTYRAHCTRCHAVTAYTGEAFTRSWATRTAYDLFELIRSTMPNDEPASLSRTQYTEIVAYLFKLNGFPAGKQPLPESREGLKQVKIEVRAEQP